MGSILLAPRVMRAAALKAFVHCHHTWARGLSGACRGVKSFLVGVRISTWCGEGSISKTRMTLTFIWDQKEKKS